MTQTAKAFIFFMFTQTYHRHTYTHTHTVYDNRGHGKDIIYHHSDTPPKHQQIYHLKKQ